MLFLLFSLLVLEILNSLVSNVSRGEEISSSVTTNDTTQKVKETLSKRDDNQEEKSFTSNSIDTKPAFLGCWSAGDRSATIAIITKRTIQTSTGTGRPLRYSLLLADEMAKTYVLELKEIDNSGFLDKYVKLKVSQKEEFVLLNLETYKSYDDLKKDKSTGQIRFVKEDDCKAVKALMKERRGF